MRRNKHHLVPKSRGGDNHKSNLLLIDMTRHLYWHKIFGNQTLTEVIRLLKRVDRAKRRLSETNRQAHRQADTLQSATACRQERQRL